MDLPFRILIAISAAAFCLAQPAVTQGQDATAKAKPKPAPASLKVTTGADPASKLLNDWFADGKAAGLDGVYYDNRDRKHSDLGIARYPQLQPITYTKEERDKKADWGGQRQIFPDKITIGNSSTASPANQAGSHQRMFYLHPRGMEFLYKQYRTNALYIYPEHRDHDPGSNGPDGYGDLYPANSPYLISSQGSSGSDKVFMHAFLKTIGAFPPETREVLVAKGLLMPTLQAIFRRSYRAVEKPADYFTGKAHPSAFDGKLIDEVAMVKLAQAMTVDAIPPLAQFTVMEETPVMKAGVDFFEPPRMTGETIADSPSSVARVFRGPAYRRTIRVSPKSSGDLLKRELKVRWVILRGDPERITIETIGKDAVDAIISVAYQPRRPISPGSPMWSNRVDIGLFVEAEGSIPSAPAFISFTTLPNEHRTYSDDGKGTPLEIFYGARTRSPGMPAIGHPRWDRLLAHFDKPDFELKSAPGIRLVTASMSDEQIAALRKAASATALARARIAAAQIKLDIITASLQEIVDQTNQVRIKATADHKKQNNAESKASLDVANRKHTAAKRAMREGDNGAAALKKEIADLRPKVVGALRANGAVEIVRSTLTAMRDDPHFFSTHEAEIRDIAEGETPAARKAERALAAALRRLSDIGVSLPSSDSGGDASLPANELYHVRQFNLDLLSDLIVADFLNRPPRLNYADPRLTVPKQWRDVFRTKADGSVSGWTRYQDGQESQYNADGQLVQGDKALPVEYVFDAKSKRLQIKVSE